jgi:hypothetical protein
MLRQTSLGLLGLIVGGILTVVGFEAYFTGNATLNLIGFFYGIPLLLGGLALRASELKPVPYTQPPTAEILALRSQQATDTQNQIRNDVTRYRYGLKAHLDSSLSHLGLSPTDEERPQLEEIWEGETDGAYTLGLKFDSHMMPVENWLKKQDKMTAFFGPGVQVVVQPIENDRIELALISTPNS